MAVLTSTQLNRMLRNLIGEWQPDPIGFGEGTINAVFQALEDEYERTGNVSGPGFKLAASSVIDTAAAPVSFTNPQKKKIGRAYLGEKFGMEAS